jgi:hypothetical protein
MHEEQRVLARRSPRTDTSRAWHQTWACGTCGDAARSSSDEGFAVQLGSTLRAAGHEADERVANLHVGVVAR